MINIIVLGQTACIQAALDHLCRDRLPVVARADVPEKQAIIR